VNAAARGGATTCLLATCQTWVSTAALPPLLRAAGARVTGLSPWPLRLCSAVAENIAGPRDPREAAATLRRLLAERHFDHVVVADDALLRALIEFGDRDALRGWFPVDPADDDALAFVLSKHAFTEGATRIGVPVPEFAFARSVDEALDAARSLDFPVVVKGPYGFGGLEVTVAHDAAAVRAASLDVLERYGRALVQRRIDGPNAGACVVYDRGVPLGFKAYLADCAYPTANSASTVHELFEHPALEPIVRAIGAATGFHGLLGIDFVIDRTTGTPFAVEVNPRPTLGFAGATANLRFFAPLLARFLGGSAERLPTAVYAGPAQLQAYFPGYLFYALRARRFGERATYRRLLACLGEIRAAELPLAAWQTLRIVRDRFAVAASSRGRSHGGFSIAGKPERRVVTDSR
jgi:glutathione synthase/RimK-type ligase-like ATP-grasp enzyme